LTRTCRWSIWFGCQAALAGGTRRPRVEGRLGLDQFEGRSFQGWHHHLTLVLVAHAFVTLQRLDPKRLRRSDDLPGRARAAAAARLLGRRVPPLLLADSHGPWHGCTPQPRRR